VAPKILVGFRVLFAMTIVTTDRATIGSMVVETKVNRAFKRGVTVARIATEKHLIVINSHMNHSIAKTFDFRDFVWIGN